MAKVRRVIRRTEKQAAGSLEDQFWPVVVAMVVLGGFLLSVILVYLDHTFMFWPSLIMLPIVITAMIVLLSRISSRTIKRSMQLALVVSLILHLVALVATLETTIFAKYLKPESELTDLVRERPPIIARDYTQVRQNEIQTDHEQIVETKTPDPRPDESQPKKEETEEPQTERPQPTPVAVPEETVKPNLTERQETRETVPRESDSLSKMSRQTNQAQAKSGVTAELPQVAQNNAQTKTQAAQTEAQRENPSQQIRRQQSNDQPSTITESREIEIAKSQTRDNPTTESTTTATMRREVAEAKITPHTAVESPEAPATPRAVETAVLPQMVAETRQSTSPTREKPTTEVAVAPSQPANPKTERSERTEQRPTEARTTTPVENRQPRETTRPSTNAVAENVPTPTTAPTESPRQPTPNPTRTSPTRRTEDSPAVARTETNAEPTPNPSPVTANTPQRTSQSADLAQSTPRSSPSPSRNAPSTTSAPSTNTSAAVAPNSPASSAISSQLQASATAAARQASASTPAATAAASASSPSTDTASTANAQNAARQPSGDPSPTVARATDSASPSRSNSAATPNAVTMAANVESSQAPTESSSPSPRPSSSAVARQSSSSPSATRSQNSATVQTASPATNVAGLTRAATDSATSPSVNPQAQPNQTASRAATASNSPTSQTTVENPAFAQSPRGAGNPATSPALTAVSRAEGGTAGIGRSQNVDRAQPSGDSPAIAASDSASRAQATQNTPRGDDFSPNQVAERSRSVADAARPSSTALATDAPNATRSGSSEPAAINATASAALTSSSSDAAQASVSASAGNVSVDLGPTKIVAEGQSGRASGGGQETLNFDTQARDVARSQSGGSPQVSVAAVTADAPSAPVGSGGGQPDIAPNPNAVAAAPSEAGSDQPVSGGPTSKVEQGPSADISTGNTRADTTLARTDAAEAIPGSPESGGGDKEDEDEEEKARARSAASGATQLAMSGPTMADVPTSPAGEPGGGGPSAAAVADAQATDVARVDTGSGAPSGGGPSAAMDEGEVSDTGGGEQIARAEAGRAEAVEAATGDVAIGGGSASPSRSEASVQLAAATQADTSAQGGAPRSSGSPDVASIDAQGIEATRIASGATGPTVSGPVGAVAGPTVAAATSSTLQGTALGLRQSSPLAGNGPEFATATNSGAPFARSSDVNLPVGTADSAVDVAMSGGTTATTDANQALGGADVGEVTRQTSGGLVVNLKAAEGPGGLGDEYAPNAGLNSRRARSESTDVQVAVNSRFIRNDSGGKLSTNTEAAITSDAFKGRRPMDEGSGGTNRAAPETEKAIEMGLVFLKRNQLPDGSWSLNNFPTKWSGMERERGDFNSDTAATSLAILCFQGAGYTHLEFDHAATVRKGIDWLIEHQADDGDLYVKMDEESSKNVWLYSHGIAALALCEAYGMTGDPRLKEPAQKAIRFIEQSQDESKGGWRYTPGFNADTSVSGWMMMALYSAKLAGLEVDSQTLTRVERFLGHAQAANGKHLYRYDPHAEPSDVKRRHGLVASPSMTSVGLLMRLYTGWTADHPDFIKGTDYLLQNLPTYGTIADVNRGDNKRDTYYWYYATMVMIHVGGEKWKQWQDRLHPLLVKSQDQEGPTAGSWNPGGRIPDKWSQFGGRLYLTTMNLLSLEVQYRKLPLYHGIAK